MMTDEQIIRWIDACNHEPSRQLLRDYMTMRYEMYRKTSLPPVDRAFLELGANTSAEEIGAYVMGWNAAHLSQPQTVAQGHVSGDCDGDPVWSFAYGESIYSIVQHPEGHQLVHTDGGELKLISKPFNLVAQGEGVATRDIAFGWRPLMSWALGTIDELNEGPMTADQWGEDAGLYQSARGLLEATPTIPTGHRVVPDEWIKIGFVERSALARLMQGSKKAETLFVVGGGCQPQDVYVKFAASPSAGGV